MHGPKVVDIVRRLLPDGSTPPQLTRIGGESAPNWDSCPPWPPDLFAVTATLIRGSGCYTEPRYVSSAKGRSAWGSARAGNIQELGGRWAENFIQVPEQIQKLWSQLVDTYSTAPVAEGKRRDEPPWWDAALDLMAYADEASAGIGFQSPEFPGSRGKSGVKSLALSDWYVWSLQFRYPSLGHQTLYTQIPESVCWMVPKAEVVVQAKSRTPQVGTSLRSLSHHLALLPPTGEVSTNWLITIPHVAGPRPARWTKPLNLLLVPFPYSVESRSFQGQLSDRCLEEDHGLTGSCEAPNYFAIRQAWLERDAQLAGSKLRKWIGGLVEAAGRQSRVDGVVLPELSLSSKIARELAEGLAAQYDLEMFVAGGLNPQGRRPPRNAVFSYVFESSGKRWRPWIQSKHHRWKIERSQVLRYQLGDALSPEHSWWEDVDISRRSVAFREFRNGATMATLVCEDLARIDPVQSVLRSVGPNLVIVLLMDGPQRMDRWSARYATVLAEDPGSSVLTLTCWGMVERCREGGEIESRQISLWAEPDKPARELNLPSGFHALLLSLCIVREASFTLDGRSDNGSSFRVCLGGVMPIKHPKTKEPLT